MNFLVDLFNQFNTYSRANPILAGVVSLWGAGVVTWLLRGVPLKIWGFFKHQCTTTLVMTNSIVGTNLETYNAFMEWLLKSKWMKYSRSLSIGGTEGNNRTGEWVEGVVVGIGDGTHFFTYAGRPYWVSRSSVAGAAMKQVLYQLNITGLGRNRQNLLNMIKDFQYKPEKGKLEIYTCEYGSWSRLTSILPRSLDSVMVEGTVKADIIGQITRYEASPDWYHTRGVPHKLTYVFHGPAGTGKTSLIKAIASHFKRSICIMSLNDVSDGRLRSLLSSIPEKAALLIEDFDSASAVSKREGIEEEASKETDGLAKLSSGITGLTLSGVLNAFDGIVSLDNRLIFMTTNVLSQIDPAMLRAGRVDHIIEIGLLEDLTIKRYIAMMFPSETVPTVEFAPIAGCELQGRYLDNRDNYDAFVADIPQKASILLGAA